MTILGDSINIINNGAVPDGGNLGSFATAPTANSIGDTYFNTTDSSVYQWDGTSWILQYTVAGGGADASNLGSFATAPVANKIGDTYFNTTDNGYYRWDGTSWVLQFTVGGVADGGNLGSFASAPVANNTGDTYFNSTDNGVYQWDGASWVALYTINYLGSFATAPSPATAGNTYYNTTTNTLMVYNGTSWVSLSGDASTLGSFATAPTATIAGDTYYNTTTNGYYRWDGTSWVLLFTLPTANPITVGASPACNTLVISAHTGINTAGVAVNIPASTFTIPAGLSGTVYVMYDVATSTVIANTTGFLTDGTVIPLGVATVPTAGGCITAWTAFMDMPEAYQAGGGASNHLGSFATAPSPAVAGNTYYNTTTNTLMVYNGTTWLSTGSDGSFVGSGTTAPAVGTTPNGSTFYNTSTDGTGGLYSLSGGVWTLQMAEDQDWKRTTAGLPYPHLTADYTSPIRHGDATSGQVQVGVNVDSTTVSLAVGSGNTTSGANSVSAGTDNVSNGLNSVSMGTLQNVQADNVMAFGSTAMTYNTPNMVGISGCKLAIDTALPTSKLHVVGLPIWSGDATAGAGGLTAGAIYTTATGSLRVKL